jgi:hypothetical protein
LAEFTLSLGTLVPFGTSEVRVLPAPLISDLTLVSFVGFTCCFLVLVTGKLSCSVLSDTDISVAS